MAEQTALLTVERDGAVATVTIDRPKAYNALNARLLRDLHQAVTALGRSDAAVIVLTGSGEKAFSAGADLDELADLDATEAHHVLREGQEVMAAVESCPVPVIAAVNGLALGGGFELVLACTFPVMSETAALGLPESGLGLIPGYGGTQRLAAAIGKPSAAHAMLTGERLTAERCHQLGLTPIPPVAPGDLMSTVRGIADTIAAKGPRAQSAILTALRTAMPSAEGLALEAALAGIATGGAEAREGIAAFRDKRTPDFAGREDEA